MWRHPLFTKMFAQNITRLDHTDRGICDHSSSHVLPGSFIRVLSYQRSITRSNLHTFSSWCRSIFVSLSLLICHSVLDYHPSWHEVLFSSHLLFHAKPTWMKCFWLKCSTVSLQGSSLSTFHVGMHQFQKFSQ